MKRILITTAALLSVSASAFAMNEMDTNGDGYLSMEELQAVYPELTEAQFTGADTDADGLISGDELTAAQDIGLLPVSEG